METRVPSHVPGVTIVVKPAEGPVCPRCRKHFTKSRHPELCERCAKVLKQ